MNKLAEDYPQNFSMGEFNSIRSYRGKIEYATNRLKRLGAGSSRIVFQVDNDKVLKLAKNEKGLAQNDVETDGYLAQHDITANVIDYDDSHDRPYWVEMELAIPINRNKKIFEKYAGISIEMLEQILIYIRTQYEFPPAFNEDNPSWEFVSEIYDIAMTMDMPLPGDLARTSSYGLVKRNGKLQLVLIDFGFTNDVRSHYYAR